MVNVLCCDIGNYSSITALKGEKPRVMRSVFQDVTYTSARDFDTEESPSVKLDNKVLVLGNRAAKQKNPQTAAERGKQLPEFVKPFTLAAGQTHLIFGMLTRQRFRPLFSFVKKF